MLHTHIQPRRVVQMSLDVQTVGVSQISGCVMEMMIVMMGRTKMLICAVSELKTFVIPLSSLQMSY